MQSDRDLGSNKTCFVVGPIGSRLDPTGTGGRVLYEEALQMWEGVFEPACEAFNLRPIRADRLADPGEIPEQIFLHLRDSDLVIADVTGGNANVMYELGLRHTRDLHTIQIGEYGKLPFDINTIRTIQFRRTEGGLIEARDSLIAAIRAALSGDGKPVTATRLWNELESADSTSVAAAVQRSLETNSEDDLSTYEPGFVDVLADGELALSEVSEILGRASAAMVETGELGESAGERVAQSDAEGRGFAGRLQIARSLAEALRSPAEVLDSAASDFIERVDRMNIMMQYMFAHWEEDSADLEESRSFGQNMISMVQSAVESETGVTTMIQGVKSLRRISRDLGPVARSLEVALNRILQGTSKMAEWLEPLTRLFDEQV